MCRRLWQIILSDYALCRQIVPYIQAIRRSLSPYKIDTARSSGKSTPLCPFFGSLPPTVCDAKKWIAPCMQWSVRQVNANSDGGNPENGVTSRAFPGILAATETSTMPSSKVSVEPFSMHLPVAPWLRRWYAPCAFLFFKCHGPTSGAFSFCFSFFVVFFFLRITVYAQAMIIKSLCSISKRARWRCKTDWTGGMSAAKRLKIARHAAYKDSLMPHACCMPR